MKRYRVGVPDRDSKSIFTDRNPGCPAVFDLSARGTVVCVCDNYRDAEWIAALLNTHPYRGGGAS